MPYPELIGAVLHDTHRIKRLIGRGGMGTVYEAEHARLPRKRFAVKVLHPAMSTDPEVFARFRREAEIATALGHPNIVEVLDFYQLPDGRPVIVMEYLEGESLHQREKRGPLAPPELIEVLTQVARGLQVAHEHGIVHRDLKPENLFLVPSAGAEQPCTAKILDFGISKVRDSTSLLTQDNTLMGTPMYMSPEQGEGLAKDVDHRSDIFSLGTIGFEALYGKLPFDAPTPSGIIYQIRFGIPDPGPSAQPRFEGRLREVLLRAMAKHQSDRYQSVSAFATDLVAALQATGQHQLDAAGASAERGRPASPTARPAVAAVAATAVGGRDRISTLSAATGELVQRSEHSRRGLLLVALGATSLILGVTLALVLPLRAPGPPVTESGLTPVAPSVQHAVDAAVDLGTHADTVGDLSTPDTAVADDGPSAQPTRRSRSKQTARRRKARPSASGSSKTGAKQRTRDTPQSPPRRPKLKRDWIVDPVIE